MRKSLDGYGCKIRKVSTYRPTNQIQVIPTSIKWNYPSNWAGVFLHKSSPRTKHSWHCSIGFLINTAPLNAYFILYNHLFFRKEFFFSNVYISVNTIFECSYLFFWLRNRPSIKYVYKWGNGGWRVIQNVYRCVQGEGYHVSCVRTHLHYLFSFFCLMVSCFICRNLT